MGRFSLLRVGVTAALMSGLMTLGAAVLAAPSADAATTYTCSGGSPTNPTLIPAGTYGSVVVTGSCYLQGTYTISGGLSVASGAELDGTVQFGFPPYGYGQPCNVFGTISGGVQVGAGGVLYLGNGEGTGCANSNLVVNGGLRAVGADTVVIHGTTFNGGFTVSGGGGAGDCTPTAASPFGSYTNVEDSTVNGGLSVTGLNTCWLGTIRNTVKGGEVLANNEMSDPDAIEVGMNTIQGNLACSGNFLNPALGPIPGGVPTDFFDGAGPFPSTVTGLKTGQCAGL